MKNNLPIGVFDSGLGGLTVVKELVKLLPNENIVYLGDTARVPYGTRSEEIVKKFSLEDANFLLSKKVKCIVIACNTASAFAGDYLKGKLKIPVFDVITPTVNEANNTQQYGHIGVIGTRGTIKSGAYAVDYSVACPLLVPFIEEGEINSEALETVIKNYLKDLKGNVNVLILGCTHYPIIEDLIQKEMGEEIELINPGKSVAREAKQFLSKNDLSNGQKTSGKKEYYVTDLTDRFVSVAEMFLGEEIKGKINRVSLD